jgi:ribonuclease H2 subunit A
MLVHLASVADEAGRGAALGPMTYGAAFWADSVNEEMCALNFDDSKAMTAEKRRALFTRLAATPQIGWMVKLISSQEIGEKMLRRVPISLNAISHECAMELVSLALKDGAKITKVMFQCDQKGLERNR